MRNWLIEGNSLLYFVLACAGIVSLFAWLQSRKRKYAVVAGICALLMFGLFLLDRSFESDNEQMVRKVSEVATAISKNDLNAAFQNVSESFERAGKNKQQFRSFCEGLLKVGRVTEVQVWDLKAVDVSHENKTGAVEFQFKVRGGWGESPPNYFGKATFTLDADGQWRIKTFDIHDSLNQSKAPVPIPGW